MLTARAHPFPGSGTGAATAIVSDSENVARLGAGLLARKRAKAASGAAAAAPKRAALMAQYASAKMDAILAWAKSARMYLVTQQEAEEIRNGPNSEPAVTSLVAFPS